ncbi:MAG: hypothetical protein MUE60_15350, partial [Candidatus Eisenbacteria bacterium]|jgi:hypothetical protein|nr:hypothetical protein [Candidatus Eisenbacteria bacterium]
MMGKWGMLMIAAMATGGPAGQETPEHAAPDSIEPADSAQAASEVPVELLENLDLLMDLEILEFAGLFGEADLGVLVPEMAEADSASNGEQ